MPYKRLHENLSGKQPTNLFEGYFFEEEEYLGTYSVIVIAEDFEFVFIIGVVLSWLWFSVAASCFLLNISLSIKADNKLPLISALVLSI